MAMPSRVHTGLGGLFVGMLLLGGATSLPELATDVTAAVAGAPDLAIGDLFGSSMANMAILAVIDLLHRGRVWPATGLGHARVAAIAMALTVILLLGLIAPTGSRRLDRPRADRARRGATSLAAAWIRRARTGPASNHAGFRMTSSLRPLGLERRPGTRPLRCHVAACAVAADSSSSPPRR